MRPFSLYVHVPYCTSKCPYCDFNSHAVARVPESRYVAALCAELAHYAARPPWSGGTVATVFFGGGTPSLLSPGAIGAVLDTVNRLWTVASGAETTLEANPGTVTLATLAGYRAAGANRISFGVQSFAARHLRRLGRAHGVAEAEAVVPMARAAGFGNVNIDLIFGVPGQTLAEWEADLDHACRLGPEHIAAYGLTYEEGTPFHAWRAAGMLRPAPEDLEAALFERTVAVLAAAGYAHYELSNYARPGFACRHNLAYWRHEPYLGVGAGAHSFSGAGGATDGTGCRWGKRWSNLRPPELYLEAVAARGQAREREEVLTERQARGEFVFLGLRCREGVRDAAFRERFGVDLETAFPEAATLEGDGLLERAQGHWRLTARGLLVADAVFATFL